MLSGLQGYRLRMALLKCVRGENFIMRREGAYEVARGSEAFACYVIIVIALLMLAAVTYLTISFPEAEMGAIGFFLFVMPIVVILYAVARLKGWTPQRDSGSYGGGAGAGGGGGGGC